MNFIIKAVELLNESEKKMRILIVGGSGMLGHQLLRQWQNKYTVAVTLRRSLADYHAFNLFGPENSYSEIDVSHLESLKRVFVIPNSRLSLSSPIVSL